MDDFKEVNAVWRGELNRAVRSGRAIVLLALFLMFLGLVMGGIGIAVRVVTNQTDQAIADAVAKGIDPADAKKQLTEQKRKFLGNFSSDEAYLSAVVELPVMLLAAFKLLTWFLPFFVALMGFDQLSGEVGPKSIRYLVVRVKRSSILLGKALAQASLLSAMLIVATLLMVGVSRAMNADFDFATIAKWTGKLLFAVVVLGAGWVAVTAFCSSLFKTPGVSLVVNIMVIIVFAALSLVGGWMRFPGEEAKGIIDQFANDESWVAYVRYGSLWHFGQNLVHPVFMQLAAAALMYIGWALGFLGLSNVILARRDL